MCHHQSRPTRFSTPTKTKSLLANCTTERGRTLYHFFFHLSKVSRKNKEMVKKESFLCVARGTTHFTKRNNHKYLVVERYARWPDGAGRTHTWKGTAEGSGHESFPTLAHWPNSRHGKCWPHAWMHQHQLKRALTKSETFEIHAPPPPFSISSTIYPAAPTHTQTRIDDKTKKKAAAEGVSIAIWNKNAPLRTKVKPIKSAIVMGVKTGSNKQSGEANKKIKELGHFL